MSAAADARRQLVMQRVAAKHRQELQQLQLPLPPEPIFVALRVITPSTNRRRKQQWLNSTYLPWERQRDAIARGELEHGVAHPELPSPSASLPFQSSSSSPSPAHSSHASHMMGNVLGAHAQAPKKQHARPPSPAAAAAEAAAFVEQEDGAASRAQPATALQQPSGDAQQHGADKFAAAGHGEPSATLSTFEQAELSTVAAAPLSSIVEPQKAADSRMDSGSTAGGDRQEQLNMGHMARRSGNAQRQQQLSGESEEQSPHVVTEQEAEHWQQQHSISKHTRMTLGWQPQMLYDVDASPSSQHLIPANAALSHSAQLSPTASTSAQRSPPAAAASTAAANAQPPPQLLQANQPPFCVGQFVAIPDRVLEHGDKRGKGAFKKEVWGKVIKDFGQTHDTFELGGRYAVHLVNANGEPLYSDSGEESLMQPYTHHMRAAPLDAAGALAGKLLGATSTATAVLASPAKSGSKHKRGSSDAEESAVEEDESDEENDDDDSEMSRSAGKPKKKKRKVTSAKPASSSKPASTPGRKQTSGKKQPAKAPFSGSTVSSESSSSGRTKGGAAAASQSGDGASVSTRTSKSSASSKSTQSQLKDAEKSARQAIHAKIAAKQKELNISVPVARIIISVNNSRKMRLKGVQDMVDTIKNYGWSDQCTLSASIYTYEQMVQLGYSPDVLQKKHAELVEDVKKNLVPPVAADRSQDEKDLADPSKNIFALVFDGQHRTHAVEKLSAELRKMTPAARALPKVMFKLARVRSCIYEHLTNVEQVMISSSLNNVSSTYIKETLLDTLNTLVHLVAAHNKQDKDNPIDVAKVTFNELCKVGSLCAASDGVDVAAQASIVNVHVFKRVVFNTFQFITMYGPDALQTRVFDPDSPLGEPEDSLLHYAYDSMKNLDWLPTFAELEEMKKKEPALVSLSSFALFVYTRLIHCRDATKQLSSGSNKMSETDPRYLKFANASAAAVATSATHVYMLWAHTLLEIEKVKQQLKAELEAAAEFDGGDANAVAPGVFEAGEIQLKNSLLNRFSPTHTWTEVHPGSPTLAAQCSQAVIEALNGMDPSKHTFENMLKYLRSPEFVSREISELKKHRLMVLSLSRETREKNKLKADEEERRKAAAELEQAAAADADAHRNVSEADGQSQQPMELDDNSQQEEPHVRNSMPPIDEAMQQPSAPLPSDLQHDEDEGNAAAAAAAAAAEPSAELAAAHDEGMEARIQKCVDNAVISSRFVVGDATLEAVVDQLQVAVKELAATVKREDKPLTDFIFLDAPKQGDNCADRFERRFRAKDLVTLVERLVTLLRPGGILAVLCDTDQLSRLWVESQDGGLGAAAWVVAPLDIVYSPDSVPKGNQHVQGLLDVNLHVLVLEKKLPHSVGASVPPACLADGDIKNPLLMKKMHLVDKPHYRRKITTVEGYKRNYQVTLPRVGQQSNPARSQLEERAHVGLSSLWRESSMQDSVRNKVCLMDENDHLDVDRSLEAAEKLIQELQKKRKDKEAITPDEAKFLDSRSQTKAMLNEQKASEHGESDDEEAGEGGAAAAKGKAKAKAKPRAMAVLHSEVSVELVQLLIARFVKVEGNSLLAADVCCGTGAVQRALVTLGDIMQLSTRCVSLDIDPHVLYYTQNVYRRNLEQFYSSYLTADRILFKQSRSQTVELSNHPAATVSGTQLLAELETLLPASNKKQQLVPVCHCCGVTLLEVRVVKSNAGPCFEYISKAGVVHKFFCGQPCADYFYESIQQADSALGRIRNTSNLFPKDAFPDGMDSAQDTEAVLASLQTQAEKYTTSLQISLEQQPSSGSAAQSSGSAAQSSSGFTIRANGVISTGTIICGVIGEIRSGEEGGADQLAQQGGLRLRLDDLEEDKLLVVSANSLAARMQRSVPGLPANAVIAAHYSLLQHGDSPLVKKHLLVPGAFVVVAETSISPNEPIVLDWPADNMAPKPIDKLAVPRPAADKGDDAQDDDLSQGITRLPGDVPFDEEPSEDAAYLHSHNERRLERTLPLVAAHAHLKEILPNKLDKFYGKLVALAGLEQLNGNALDGGLLSLAVFRAAVHPFFSLDKGQVLLAKPTGDSVKVLTAFSAALCAVQQTNEIRQRPMPARASSRHATVTGPNELEESKFGDDLEESKKWEDAEQDRSLASLRAMNEAKPILIVNRAYCQLLECVLTSAAGRSNLVGVALFIALGTCAQWFDTYNLDEESVRASTACLQAWLEAVMAAIEDKELLPRLMQAKEAFEKQKQPFFPWVIVKSLSALALQIDRVIRSRSKAASPPPLSLAQTEGEEILEGAPAKLKRRVNPPIDEAKYNDPEDEEEKSHDSASDSPVAAATFASNSPIGSVPSSPNSSSLGGDAVPPSAAGGKRVDAPEAHISDQHPSKKARVNEPVAADSDAAAASVTA